MNNRERREYKYSTMPALFLGLVMVAVGVIMTSLRVFEVNYGESTFFVEDNDFGLIGRAILIVGGMIIITMRRRGNYFAVGVYALTLGLSRVIRSIPGLFDESDLVFYISLVFTIVGGNLAWGGYNHLTVKTRNPATMRYTALLLLFVVGLTFGYMIYSDIDVVEAFLSEVNMFGYLPLYVGLLIVLYSKELLENIPLARVSRFLKDVSSNGYAGDTLKITDEDAETIKEGFSGAEGWSEIHVGELTIKEAHISFHAHNGVKDVILEKWPHSDSLYVSLVNDRTDSFIGGQRMNVTGFEVVDDTMYLFDSGGTCTIMKIGGDLQ